MNCFQKNYLWTDLQGTACNGQHRPGCELLSKKLPLDWFTGPSQRTCYSYELWIAFKKTTFGLIYRRGTVQGIRAPVVNCFQKNYLWTDLQVFAAGVSHSIGCELLSKKLPLDWFTGPRYGEDVLRRLWIAFKKTTFGLIYRLRLAVLYPSSVVNCFQKNYLWTDLQVPVCQDTRRLRCELLSKKLPLDWFTGHNPEIAGSSPLWIAFKKTTFGLIYRTTQNFAIALLVVNCFQKNYLWTDLQANGNTQPARSSCELLSKKLPLDWFTGDSTPIFSSASCELLSKKLPLDWFTGNRWSGNAGQSCELLSKKLPLDWFTGAARGTAAGEVLWIAFKKTTFGLIYRPLFLLVYNPLVVNCFQKNYLWTDLQVLAAYQLERNGCELLSKKLPLDWFTGSR